MVDYTLYYWPVQFRGQFVRAVLAYVSSSWDEAGFDETFAQRASEPNAQLVPHMGPPVLTDHSQDIHISQMPAILAYLGEKYGLLTDDLVLKAMNYGATFSQASYFWLATFAQDVSFFSGTFTREAYFNTAVFSGFAWFARCRFKATVDFTDCQFEKSTNFRLAQFVADYPVLDGADLHLTTRFTARDTGEFQIDGEDAGTEERRLWPENIVGGQSELKAALQSVSIIRHAVGRQGRPEDEHFFFRKEMRYATRIGGWWQRLPYRFFGLVSEFGYSIKKPAVGLFLVWLVPALLIWVLSYPAIFVIFDEIGRAGNAFALSFANTFPFFGFRGAYFDAKVLQALPWWVKLISATQTVFGFILLFFLGLGLRTRFRLR